MRFRLFPKFDDLVLRLAIACGVVFFLPFVSRFHWLLDLGSHFQVQAVAGMMMLLGLALVQRKWVNASVIGFVSLIGVWHVSPLFLPEGEFKGETVFQVTGFNVLTGNSDDESVVEHLRETGSDVLVLMETDERWVSVLKRGLPEYEESFSVPRSDGFGMLILSKLPFEKKLWEEPTELPLLQVDCALGERRVAIIAVHPIPPMGKSNATRNAEYLGEVEALCREAREKGMLPLVVGDLNATPWSVGYRDLVNRTGLKSAASGEGELTTWNRFKNRNVPFSGLMIDYILYGEGLKKTSFSVGPATESDHCSVTASFSF